MIIFIFVGLMVLNTFLCNNGIFQSINEYNFNSQKSIQNFPWIVIISQNSTLEIITFGSLFHPGAVLTHAVDINNQSYLDFQVSAGCQFRKNIQSFPLYHCSDARGIHQIYIVEHFIDIENYYKNFLILLLSRPFKLNEGISVINLARNSNGYDPKKCIMLCLMSLPLFRVFEPTGFITPVIVKHEENHSQLRINWADIENKLPYSYKKMISDGNPVICLSKKNSNKWILTFLSYITVERNPNNDLMTFRSAAMRVSPFKKFFYALVSAKS